MQNKSSKIASLQQEICEKFVFLCIFWFSLRKQRIHQLNAEISAGLQQLKDLNGFLSNNLDRLTFKKPSSSQEFKAFSQENPDFLQKLLDCGNKRKKVLQKDLFSLKNLQESASVEK